MQHGNTFREWAFAVAKSCGLTAPVQSQRQRGKVGVSYRLQDADSFLFLLLSLALCPRDQLQHCIPTFGSIYFAVLRPRTEH